MKMIELDDRWSLEGTGDVTRLVIDWAVSLTIAAPGSSVDIRVEQPFSLVDPTGLATRVMPEGEPSDLAPALRLARGTVSRLDAFKDGSLELGIQDGTQVRVEAGSEFEAWELVTSAGLRIVSMPGGEITVWSPPQNSSGD